MTRRNYGSYSGSARAYHRSLTKTAHIQTKAEEERDRAKDRERLYKSWNDPVARARRDADKTVQAAFANAFVGSLCAVPVILKLSKFYEVMIANFFQACCVNTQKYQTDKAQALPIDAKYSHTKEKRNKKQEALTFWINRVTVSVIDMNTRRENEIIMPESSAKFNHFRRNMDPEFSIEAVSSLCVGETLLFLET